jgi:hypothetical protein
MKFLFTCYYRGAKKRNKEMDKCLKENLKVFDTIVLLVDDGSTPPVNDKIIVREFKHRPTFSDFFNTAREFNCEYSVFANSDIFFDDSVSHFSDLKISDGVHECYALTRWEYKSGLQEMIYDSQDAWVFKDIFKPTYCDYTMGRAGCDNRLAYELSNVGYKVINPSSKIKCWHVHDEKPRNFDNKERVKPPYKMVEIE